MNMAPSFPLNYLVNTPGANAERLCNVYQLPPKASGFSYSNDVGFFKRCLEVVFTARAGLINSIPRVFDVLLWSHIFKVIKSIVCRVVIYVVGVSPIGIATKRKHDNPVDGGSFPFAAFVKTDGCIPLDAWDENLVAENAPSVNGPTDSAEIRNFVQPLVTGDCLPDFSCGNAIISHDAGLLVRTVKWLERWEVVKTFCRSFFIRHHVNSSQVNKWQVAKILIPCILALSLTGCATMPYGSSATPHATAQISDTGTSATLDMGAVGEFVFVSNWAKSGDGSTTGSVTITATKATMDNFLAGGLGLLTGLVAGAGAP